MNVLLTGSTGFLGSYLLTNLDSFSLLPYSRKEKNRVNWDNINGVVHCAGLAHNSHKKNLKELYYKANVQLTKDLIANFIDSPANFFIFISTSTIYENSSHEKNVDETAVGDNLSVYAESKLEAEIELLKIQNKKIFILRPSVIVGPNPKGNIRLLHRLIKTKLPIPIPRYSSPNNLTDIRNLTEVIEYLVKNYNIVESGIYNVNDNLAPDLAAILRSIATNEGVKVRLIKIPNKIFKFGLRILSLTKPEISKKLHSLFFNQIKISNQKISKIVDLKYNSFQ